MGHELALEEAADLVAEQVVLVRKGGTAGKV
jgi:hypothetical protein